MGNFKLLIRKINRKTTFGEKIDFTHVFRYYGREKSKKPNN